MATNPIEFIQQVRVEAGKIAWPSRAETVTTTVFVIILVLFAGLFLFAVDWIVGEFIQWVLSFTS